MDEKISKLEGAERQLSAAIALYFERGDALSIHSLAAAAHQVIYDLCLKRGIRQSLLKDCLYIRPEFRKEWLRKVAESENFLKHADRDPDGVLSFNPDFTVYFIFDAIELHFKLTGRMLPVSTIFSLHFMQLYPGVFEGDVPRQLLGSLAAMRVGPSDFHFFSQAIALLRTQKTPERVMEYLRAGGSLPGKKIG